MRAREGRPGGDAAPALVCLVALAALVPWALGGAPLPALRVVGAAALSTAALVAGAGAFRRGVALPAVPLWPLGAFVALALVQLVPLPAARARRDRARVARRLAPRGPRGGRSARRGPAARLARPAHDAVGGGARERARSPRRPRRPAPRARPGGAVAPPARSPPAGSLLAAYAIFARARFGSLLYGSIRVPTVFPFGPFVNKNHFAGWAAMAFPIGAGLAVGLVAAARARGERDWTTGRGAVGVVLCVVAALAMALSVVVSLSRGGAFALVVGALALAALVVPRAGAGRSARVLAPAALVCRRPRRRRGRRRARVRARAAAHAERRLLPARDVEGLALRLAASSPLVGSGLGAFHDAYPRFKTGYGAERVEHAESEYLETLAETGAAGLACTLAGLFLLLRSAATGAGAAGRGVAWAVGCGGAAAVVALAAHGLLDFDLRVPSNAALAALAAAAAAGLAGPRARPMSRPACAALSLGALALLAASAAAPPAPSPAARDELRLAAEAPSPAVRELRLARAEAAAAAALSRRPADPEPWLLLAYARAARGDRAPPPPWRGTRRASTRAGPGCARPSARSRGRPTGRDGAIDLDRGRRGRLGSAHSRWTGRPSGAACRPASAARKRPCRASRPRSPAPRRAEPAAGAGGPAVRPRRPRSASSSSRRRCARCASSCARRGSRSSRERSTRERLEEEVRALADQDPLTGLASARRLGDRLGVAVIHAQRYRQKLAVVQLGLDRFAEVNDKLGRSHGDDLLRSVALALESTLRQGDTIARLGGDVFTILLPGIKRDEDVTVIADKLRLALRSPFSIGGHDLLVTASIGIALFPDDGPDTETLLQSATVAMRRAKERGGDGVGRARAALARARRRAPGPRDGAAARARAGRARAVLAAGRRVRDGRDRRDGVAAALARTRRAS